MEQFLLESSDYILKFTSVVTIITVGVMAILLPIFVLGISWRTARINKKLDKVLALMSEQVKLTKKMVEYARTNEENCQASPSVASVPLAKANPVEAIEEK